MILLSLRKLILASSFLAAVSFAAEIKTGATYAEVLKEKGLPESKIESGGNHILNYRNSTIKLRDGVVTEVQHTPARLASSNNQNTKLVAANATSASRGIEAPLAWQTDYQAALAKAKGENRHVFLFFTGSDWCSWCMRLKKEILSTPEFAGYSAEKLILVEIDFPRKKKLGAALKKQNANLAEQYDIKGYPTVIILDGSGKKIDELGYQEGGPGPFIDRLKKS